MWFDGWMPLGRIVLVGTLAYLALVVMLRVTGKRTLSKLNAFDLVVTVALGSTLSTVLLSKDVPLAEGMAALALLVGLQWIITALSVRSRRISGWVKAEPSLLFIDGRFLERALHHERVTTDEVRASVRQQGFSRMDQVAAVVLETDGSLNVIGHPAERPWTTLEDVEGGLAEASEIPVHRDQP